MRLFLFSNTVFRHQQFKRSFSNAETSCLPIKLSPKHFEALVTTWISWKNDFKSGQRFSHQIFRNCSFRYHFVKVKFRIRSTYLVLIFRSDWSICRWQSSQSLATLHWRHCGSYNQLQRFLDQDPQIEKLQTSIRCCLWYRVIISLKISHNGNSNYRIPSKTTRTRI